MPGFVIQVPQGEGQEWCWLWMLEEHSLNEMNTEKQLDSQRTAYGRLPLHKKRTRQRTMSSAEVKALALAIYSLSQGTLNLVHSRLCTSAYKISVFKPGQLCSASRQTKLR